MLVCAAVGVAAWTLVEVVVPKSGGFAAFARSAGRAHAKNIPTRAAAGRTRGTAFCMHTSVGVGAQDGKTPEEGGRSNESAGWRPPGDGKDCTAIVKCILEIRSCQGLPGFVPAATRVAASGLKRWIVRLDQACRHQTIERAPRLAQAQVAGLERRLELGQTEVTGVQVLEQDAVHRPQLEAGSPARLGGIQLRARVLRCLGGSHRLTVTLDGFASFVGHLEPLARLPGSDALRVSPVVRQVGLLSGRCGRTNV